MSVFNKSVSKVFQSSVYYNSGPLKYNNSTGEWGPFNYTQSYNSVPLTKASAARQLALEYSKTFVTGTVTSYQATAIHSTINSLVNSNPPPSGNYNDVSWQNKIWNKTSNTLNSSASTLNYYGKTSKFSNCGSNSTTFDPLAQNFFIDAARYSNGVFLSSIGLYFVTKDDTIPVSIQIVGVTNGYPDISKPITGSKVIKNPSDINIPLVADQTSSIGPQTKFTFDYPIYLSPGQYSIIIMSNSNNYTMYASVMGKVQYGTTKVVSSPTYGGVMFKSQNASTWVAATGTGTQAQTVSESLCFAINICSFAGGLANFQMKSKAEGKSTLYDLVNLTTNDLTFNTLDSISYALSTTDALTYVKSGLASITSNRNTQMATRQVQESDNDITLQCTLSNNDTFTSPVVDLQRMSNIVIKNRISSYNTANTAVEVLPGNGNKGGATSKYITKIVTLADGFNSTGLTVYVDVNRQPGTKIEVYYKVMSPYDNNLFDQNPYVLMTPILYPGISLADTGANDWTQDTYQALDISYSDVSTGAVYDNFNKFAIKVCFYSENPAVVPQIKNFRAIATA